MKENLMRMLAVFMLLAASTVSVYAEDALEIAIWPYMSTQALLSGYQPLRVYLEQQLHRPVIFITAPNEEAFVARTQKGEYRFVITAPHFARLAQQEAWYVPMLRATRQNVGEFLVQKDSKLHSISDLRGKTVTLPDKLTLMAMLGLQALRDHGLEPGRDVTIRYAVSHNSAVLDVLRGESDAAATSATLVDQMSEEIRDGVRILAQTGEVSALIFMANQKVPARETAEMTRLILDFSRHTPEGLKFINDLGYQGLRPPTEAEMQRLDPHVVELKKLLNQQ